MNIIRLQGLGTVQYEEEWPPPETIAVIYGSITGFIAIADITAVDDATVSFFDQTDTVHLIAFTRGSCSTMSPFPEDVPLALGAEYEVS